MSDRQKAFISIIVGSIVGGVVSTFMKVGLNEIPPLSFAFLRFFLASLIIFPFILKKKKNIIKHFIAISPISLFATANIALFVLGIRYTTATVSQILYAAVPLFIGLVSYLFLSQRLPLNKIWGIILGFLGIVVVVVLPILEKGRSFSGDLSGNLIITLGVVCYSIYMILSKKIQEKYSPFEITSIFIFLTSIVLFPFFLLELRSYSGWWNHATLIDYSTIIYSALFATVFAYILGQYAIKHGGAIFASMSFYVQPIVAFVSASFILGEKLTAGIIIGGSLALLGVFITTKK
ncbi:MAG: DMT family transporter [Candidatus Levybacteria bacterium]|nr:DMT family transporter [Candidatus Levybacteria bacterium]